MVVATRLSIIYLIVIVQTAELAKECINTRPVFPWAQSIAFLTRRQFYKKNNINAYNTKKNRYVMKIYYLKNKINLIINMLLFKNKFIEKIKVFFFDRRPFLGTIENQKG
jgi:hypothetical protein